jgi:hypothetical protein
MKELLCSPTGTLTGSGPAKCRRCHTGNQKGCERGYGIEQGADVVAVDAAGAEVEPSGTYGKDQEVDCVGVDVLRVVDGVHVKVACQGESGMELEVRMLAAVAGQPTSA